MSEALADPGSCIRELAEINRDIGSFGHQWATDAGNLKSKLELRQRVLRAALRGLSGEKLTIPEKEATAHIALEEKAPGLEEDIERLEGAVEGYKTRFKTLERRSSNAQSILSAYRDEGKMTGHVFPRPAA